MRVLRDGGTALYQVAQNSWRIIEVVRSSTNLGVTAKELNSNGVLGVEGVGRGWEGVAQEQTEGWELLQVR